MVRVNRFWIILPVLAGILLLSTMQSSGLTPRVVDTPQFPVASGSWNPRVSCSSPWIIRITDMTNNMTGSASFTNSIFNPGITSPVGDAKRWLTPGATPPGWHTPGPPCTITNSHGQVSMFVEIDGVKRGTIGNGDCTGTYDTVNGGSSNGGNYCDTDFNIYDPAVVPNYPSSCSNASDPTCYGRIHIEIDHDWKAAGYCGASTACDDVAMNSQTNSSSVIDVQGFVYWDADNVNQQWHSFSGWEIHAVTGWRFHQSSPPPNPPPGSYFDHLVVIVMENQGIFNICGPRLPCNGSNSTYMSSLANTYGIGSQYLSLFNSSLPNYVGMIGGSTFSCTGSGCPTISNANLVDRLESAGLTWKGYMESQTATSGCVSTGQPSYDPRHNPFVWYTDITSSNRCNKIVLANPGSCGTVTDCTLINDLNSSSTPNFMWLTPNICNDMHGNSTCTNGCTVLGSTACIVDGDNYLNSLIPSILNSKTFTTQRSALFVTFDEGNGYCPLNNNNEDCMYAVWAGPQIKTGFVTSRLYNHYSFLKTAEVNWNLTSLTTNDANATPMTEFFASGTGQQLDPPTGSYFDHVVVIMMENEGMNDICNRNPPPCSGPNSPYMSGLANNYSISQRYLPLINTSEPNYYGILGASIFGCPTDCYPPVGGINAPNLVDRFEAVGLSWKGYMENQNVALGCDGTTHEPYEHEHNGFVSFQNIYTNSTRCGKIARANPTSCGSVTDCVLVNDLNSFSAPNFMWLTPNDCNNMHANSICTTGNGYNGCTTAGSNCIKKGDDYLKSLVPNILKSYAFQSQRSALFIVFDEGTGTGCPLNGSSENCLYAVWAGPVAKTGFSSPQLYNQYSLTKTIEVNWNLTTLTANDAAAIPMAEFFRPVPNFTISVTSPGPVNVGQSTNSIITVTSVNGFSGTVSLTDTVPGGLTCSAISPSSVIGSGTATLSCSSNTAGRYTPTVTGTSSSLVHSSNATFNFVDFTITPSSPAPVNVGQSPSSTVTITALNGFAGIVALTDTVPSGLSCGAITPTSITGSGTSTVSCSSAIAANYNLTLLGTSGSLIHSTTAVFRFQDFTINASAPPAANAASSTSSTITIAPLNGFGSTVSLSDTIPSGLFCSAITPTSVTGSGTATVSCTSSSAGNFTLTVTGTSGSLVHSTTAAFRFQDFNITASIPTAVKSGVSATSTITVTALNHFSGTVSLSDSVPNGLTCGAITPGSLTGSGTATISCSATVAGNYTLTTTGTSTSLIHGTIVTFIVQDFTVSTSVLPAYVGVSVSSTITIVALNHFGGLVNLTNTVPSGLTCGPLTPTSITGSGTATVSCSATVAGNYTLTITATSTPLVHTATATFQFQDFTITATSPGPVNAGQSAISTVNVAAVNGFSGTVTFSVTPSPGLSCGSFTPTSVTGSGSATISCNATVAGNYTATIIGTSTPLIHNSTSTFQFRDFTMTATFPAPVNAGSSATSTITVVALNHFAGLVSLTDTVPSGLTCGAFTPSGVTGSGSVTVSCSANAPGNYNLTITGTSGTLSHSTSAMFVVVDFAVSISPNTIMILVGSSHNSTVTVVALNQFNGTVSLITSSPAALTTALSPSSTTGSGNSTLTVTATIPGNYTITVVATSGSLSHTITLTVRAMDFAMTVDPGYSIVVVGSNINANPTLTSLGGFSGNLTLTVTVLDPINIPPTVPSSGTHLPIRMDPLPLLPSASTSPGWILLGSGGLGGFTITISASPGVAAAYYPLIVTASNGTMSHSILITIIVRDFSLTAPISSVTMIPGTNSTTTLGLQSLDGFFGNATLTVQGGSGEVSGSLSTSIVYIPFNGGGNAVLTIQVSSAASPGNYTLIIQATSGTTSHTITILVIVRSSLFATILSRMLTSTTLASSTTTGLLSLLFLFSMITGQQRRNRRLRVPRRAFQFWARWKTTRLCPPAHSKEIV